MNLQPEQVVKIINKNHRYYGMEAVIRYKTDKMYNIRLRNMMKPLHTRFSGFRGNKPSSILSPLITMYITPESVKKINGKFAPTLLNKWQPETLHFLKKYEKMTKQQIEKKLKKTLIPWELYEKQNYK